MKKIATNCILVVSLLTTSIAQKSAHYGAPKFAPPNGKKLLIIGQDLGSVGGLDSHSDGYVDSITTHIPAGVTTYTDIPNLGGLKSQRNWGAGDINAQAYSQDETFDNAFVVIGVYMVNRLNGIKDGFFNSSIRQLAQWCKDQERPIFLRIGYEFEGPWNNYKASDFKAAWQQIVHVFDEEDVRNVAYVWQSAGLNRSNIINWYPGDEYVNWVGYSHFDGFNMGQSIRDFAEEHDKPIMIAEATPRRQLKTGSPETHWRSWFLPLFEGIYANNRIKALAYINADWESQSMWQGQGWGDSRVQVVAYIKNAWLNEIAKDPWITASDSLFDILQYQTWLDSIATNTVEALPSGEIDIRKDIATIYITALDNQPIETVRVWDFSGRLLYQYTQSATQYRIPIGQLSTNAIIITIRKDGRLYQRKEVITK